MFTNRGFDQGGIMFPGKIIFLRLFAHFLDEPVKFKLQQRLPHRFEFCVGAVVEAFMEEGAELLRVFGGERTHAFCHSIAPRTGQPLVFQRLRRTLGKNSLTPFALCR